MSDGFGCTMPTTLGMRIIPSTAFIHTHIHTHTHAPLQVCISGERAWGFRLTLVVATEASGSCKYTCTTSSLSRGPVLATRTVSVRGSHGPMDVALAERSEYVKEVYDRPDCVRA